MKPIDESNESETLPRHPRAAASEAPIEPPAERLRRTRSQNAMAGAKGKSARIPRELSAIAMKALAPKPGDRYGSAQEFGEEIQRFLERRPVLACPDSPARRVMKWAWRNRALAGGGVAVLLALVIAAVSVRAYIR